MAKVIIYLRDNELSALHTLAQQEYRVLKAQAALIIRQELQRRGMIPAEADAASILSPVQSESAEHLPSIPVDRSSDQSGLIIESEA